MAVSYFENTPFFRNRLHADFCEHMATNENISHRLYKFKPIVTKLYHIIH